MSAVTAAPFGNATTHGSSLRLVEPATTDTAVRAWSRRPNSASRDDLLAAARERLQGLVETSARHASHEATRSLLAVSVVNGVLERLMLDGSATPQFAPGVDGGVEVEWLVNGRSLFIGVLSDGETIMTAEGADGTVHLDREFPFWAIDFSFIEEAKAYLKELSLDVQHRR